MTGNRAHMHDGSAAGSAHGVHFVLRAQEYSPYVRAEDLIEFGRGIVQESGIHFEAGTVYRAIEPAVVIDRDLDRRLDLRFIAKIQVVQPLLKCGWIHWSRRLASPMERRVVARCRSSGGQAAIPGGREAGCADSAASVVCA